MGSVVATEMALVSMERAGEYMKVQKENVDDVASLATWKPRGKIEFVSAVLCYASRAAPALQSVSFSILPGQKVRF